MSSEIFLREPIGHQVDATVIYNLSEMTGIVGSLSYYNFDELYPIVYPLDDNNFKTIPLLIGVKFLFPAKSIHPYISGQVGIHFVERNYTKETYDIRLGALYRLVSSEKIHETSTNFAFRICFGVCIALCDRFEADLSLRYDDISLKYIDNYRRNTSSRNIDLHSLNIGILYKL